MKNDLLDCKIDLTFEQISQMSKYQFKKLVKNKTELACFRHLLEEKSKLSKGSDISYTKFEMQPYLQPGNNLNIDQMRKIS